MFYSLRCKQYDFASLPLVSNTKIRVFQFGDGFFIRKVRPVNSRTRTPNLAQPGLHGIDLLFRALHLTCHGAFACILYPANHSYLLSFPFCVHSEANTLHSPEHLVVHGLERRGHGGEASGEQAERGARRGDCAGKPKQIHGRRAAPVTRPKAANEPAGQAGTPASAASRRPALAAARGKARVRERSLRSTVRRGPGLVKASGLCASPVFDVWLVGKGCFDNLIRSERN